MARIASGADAEVADPAHQLVRRHVGTDLPAPQQDQTLIGVQVNRPHSEHPTDSTPSRCATAAADCPTPGSSPVDAATSLIFANRISGNARRVLGNRRGFATFNAGSLPPTGTRRRRPDHHTPAKAVVDHAFTHRNTCRVLHPDAGVRGVVKRAQRHHRRVGRPTDFHGPLAGIEPRLVEWPARIDHGEADRTA